MAPPPSSGLRPNLWLAWPSDRPGPGRRDPDHPVFPDRDRTVDKIVALVAQAADRARPHRARRLLPHRRTPRGQRSTSHPAATRRLATTRHPPVTDQPGHERRP